MWDFPIILTQGDPTVLRKRYSEEKIISVPMLVPDSINQRRSMDFVSDQLANGRRFRILNIVDHCSRGVPVQIVDFSISGYIDHWVKNTAGSVR